MRNFDFLVVVILVASVYLYVGKQCWSRLLSHSTTAEDLDLFVMSEMTIQGRLGMWFMIAIWPIWTVVASAYFALERVFRAEVEKNDLFCTSPRID